MSGLHQIHTPSVISSVFSGLEPRKVQSTCVIKIILSERVCWKKCENVTVFL